MKLDEKAIKWIIRKREGNSKMKLKMLGYAKEERNKKKKEQVTKEKLNDCGIQTVLMEWITAYLDDASNAMMPYEKR